MPTRKGSGLHPAPSRPRLVPMPLACDAHAMVIGPADRFPLAARAEGPVADAPKEALNLLHALLGFDRGVLVQPDCHGLDHHALVDALGALGEGYRGVAILGQATDAARIALLHRAGVRAVRIDLVSQRPVVAPGRVPLDRIADPGWHVEIDAPPEALDAVRAILARTSCPVVITGTGRLPVAEGTHGAAFRALAALLTEERRLWIKLDGAERISAAGPPYRDVDPIARALFEAAPDRALWGTGWPHPGLPGGAPDAGMLVDRLAAICPDRGALRRLLVENPSRLYWRDAGA